ncbi:MAG: 6-phosphofructokinase [Candidatus Portiera sp.]|nr:6-phosphofructokinase [Portiera sp.]
MKKNLIYIQSGGVSSVINASACGVIETARKHTDKIDKIYAAVYGIGGFLQENIYDITDESADNVAAFRWTPGGIFGSCRHRMPDLTEDESEYMRIYELFKAHNIGYFFYNGGGGSMDAANKLANYCKSKDWDVKCLGIPKTIDNDLGYMDNCPGYGSVAKFTATATMESGLDVASMHTASTKVLLMEVMGRHAGWIAAAAGLAHTDDASHPHIIIFPEIPLNKIELLHKVDACVKKNDYCVMVVAEGARDEQGELVSTAGVGAHKQLGGAANVIAMLISQLLGYKFHCVICDYLQRSARHLSSLVDVEQAYAVGEAAVEYALQGKNAIMPTIERVSSSPYKWKVGEVELIKAANSEKLLPRNYISKDGYSITQDAEEHIRPLIQGENPPPYENGLPVFATKNFKMLAKKLPEFN